MIKISIDAGHGGKDRGCSAGDFVESFFTEKMARMVEYSSRALGFCTYRTGYGLRKPDRAKIAGFFGADLAVSIHADANPNPKTCGLMTYVCPGNIVQEQVANAIMTAAPPELERKVAGEKQPQKRIVTSPNNWTSRANNVLKHYDCPAVLVECGIVTNKGNLEFLESPYGKIAICHAIVAGIVKFADMHRQLFGL